MGSSLGCANSRVQDTRGVATNSRLSDATVKCPRHNTNDVTHYNAASKRLMCLSCYQTERRSQINDGHTVQEIGTYTSSLSFKQWANKLLASSRVVENRCDYIARHYGQAIESFESKRSELVNEVASFIESLIDLLVHLKDDLCKDIHLEIDIAILGAEEFSKTVAGALRELKSLSARAHNSNIHSTLKLKSMLDLDSFIRDINVQTKEYTNYSSSLKLNKSMTLREVLGKLKASRKVTLGEFKVNTNTVQSPGALSETNEFTDDSSCPPSRECSPHTSKRYVQDAENRAATKGYSKHINPVKEPIEPKQSLFEAVRSSRTPGGRQPMVCDIQIENYENRHPNGYEASHPEQVPRAQSVPVPNRVTSRVQTFSRQSQLTPRRSGLSAVSPSKIDTPAFVTPRPNAPNSVHVEFSTVKQVKTIQLPKDEHVLNITSSVIFNDRNIVLCDQKNSTLSLYNENFDRIDKIKFVSHPHAVAKVPNYGVVATFPEENSIKLIKIENGLFWDTVENFTNKRDCRGIEFFDGNLIYTTENDIKVIRKDDPKQLTWKFNNAFRRPMSLCVDYKDSSLFVTCFGIKKTVGEVVRMKFPEQTVEFVTRCSEIYRPVGLAVDRHGYIYVCDVKPHGLHQLSPSGQYLRKILGENDGKFQHINFFPNSDMFLITENNCDKLKIYELE